MWGSTVVGVLDVVLGGFRCGFSWVLVEVLIAFQMGFLLGF
jgi:hypothetical protein